MNGMTRNQVQQIAMNESTLIQQNSSSFKLRSTNGNQEFSLNQPEILVGREVECQIALKSGHISRYHAKITLMPQEVVVEDLRSTNGTFINGRRITSPQTAHLGDEIRFHELAFRLVSAEESSGQEDVTVFQQALNDFDAIPVQEPAQDRPVSPPAPAMKEPVQPPRPAEPSTPERAPVQTPQQEVAQPLDDDADSTRLLSLNDLNRLQGKAERSNASMDNGSGPRLVVMTAPIRGKVHSLISTKKNAWLIGRGKECEFQLHDQTVSAQHARIRKLSDEWVLEACEGRNPIFVNNREVEFTTLNPGDVVRIGRMELIFRVDEKSLVEEKPEPKARPSSLNVALLLGALVVFGVVLGVIFA